MEDFELKVITKMSGGSEQDQIQIAALNIRGAPHAMKNLDKSIKLTDIIEKNEIVMLLETGCVDKLPDVGINSARVVNNNYAKTEKKEQYIHCGKGTALIAHKNILT